MNTPPRTPIRSYIQRAIFSLMALVVCLPSIALAQAQTGTITGRVLNRGTQEYLRNAVVKVLGTDISTTAEAGGNYTLNNLAAGEVKVSFSYAGLDTQEIAITVLAGQTVTKDISLTSADYADDVIQLGEFVVASEKEGNAKAIMEQKNSLEAKRVIASDTFGSTSEGNVGEFLKYLPGVQIDYTEADARSVSLGGLDPKYTSVTIDGAPIASSGLAAASGVTASRGFEFEQISINSIETVELSRTPQPENPGSALAGGVNLRSKSAFDRQGRMIRLNAGLAANSMSGNLLKKQPGWDDEDHYRVQPNWGIEYSDVFLDKRLGVIAGYNYSYTFSEQKAESVTYAAPDTNPSNNDTEVLRVTGITFRDSPKPTIRYNANLRLDYKINTDLWISGRAEYNSYHAKFFSRDLNFGFGSRTTTGTAPNLVYYNDIVNAPDPDGSGPFPAGPVQAGVEYSLNSQTIANNAGGVNAAGVPVAGTVGGGGSVLINQGGGATNKYGSTANYAFEAHYKTGAFQADFSANMSRSMTWYKNELFGFFWAVTPGSLNNLGLRFNRNGPSDPAVFITQTAGADYKNLANHPNGFTVISNDRQGEDQQYLLRLDTKYDANLGGLPIVFKQGVHVRETVNNADRSLPNNFGNGSFRRVGPSLTTDAEENPSLWAEKSYRMNFDYGGNVDGLANLDRWALYKDYIAHPEWWTGAVTANNILQGKLQNARDAKEQVDAVYSQAIVKWGKFTLAPGFRYERTRGSASGPVARSDNETRLLLTGSTAAVAGDTATAQFIQTKYGNRSFAHQDYGTWLRYLHGTYRFTDNLVLKSSFTQGIYRPDMNWLTGGLSVVTEDLTAGTANVADAGNKDLKPEQSDTINVSLEYYTKKVGSITASVYRRDLKNMIKRIDIEGLTEWNGEQLPKLVSQPGFPADTWTIRARSNVVKAHMSSAELSFIRELDFLPGPLSKVRLNANYTHIEYDNYENFLRGQNVANAGWYIPYRSFKLRWNSNWREGYRTEIMSPLVLAGTVTIAPSAAAVNGWALYTRESFTHTMDFTWDFMRNAQFYITARNIFNQDQGTYVGRSDVRVRWIKTGAIWTSGVTYRF